MCSNLPKLQQNCLKQLTLAISAFCGVAASLGDKLGALLFQLPPNLKKDLAVFDAFLEDLPPKVCAAFEFRHESWLDEEIFTRLSARNLALCVADSGERGIRGPAKRDGGVGAPGVRKVSTPVRVTADYAYFRLRDEGYKPDDIAQWGDTIARVTESCRDVFVYFMHEDEALGTQFAVRLAEAWRITSRV